MKEAESPKEPQYLTKEDLEVLNETQPKWRRLRIGMLVGFGVIWVGLVIAVILVVVLSQKCPPRPDLTFWQSAVGYYVDVFAFKDSGEDFVGDFKGLANSLSYFKEVVTAGFIILAPIQSGYFTNKGVSLGLVDDHTKIDPALGTWKEFDRLVRKFHKKGLQTVISLDFNAIDVNHVWMKNPNFPKKYDSMLGWSSRYDRSPTITHKGQQYYSVDNKLVDIDLTKEEVITEVLNVVKSWLNKDVDGILLKNAAFFVEDDAIPSDTDTLSTDSWSTKYPAKQIFQNKSVEVVKRVRKVIDEYSSSRGKPCLLIVDPGDTGYGLEMDESKGLMFLGSDSEPAAHLIMHPEFTFNRGWKLPTTVPVMFSLNAYNATSGSSKNSLALFTASEEYRRHSALLQSAASIVLPGTPLIYYGAELGMEWSEINEPPTIIYPKGKVPNIGDNTGILTCHLPMPWEISGERFSQNKTVQQVFPSYIDQFKLTDTVETLNADGRGRTLWTVIQKLAHIRSKLEPLMWGSFSYHRSPTPSKRIEIVERRAEGFGPAFAIFYNPALDPDDTKNGVAIDFSRTCQYVFVHIAYPDVGLEEGKLLGSLVVYIKFGSEPAFYLVQCQ